MIQSLSIIECFLELEKVQSQIRLCPKNIPLEKIRAFRYRPSGVYGGYFSFQWYVEYFRPGSRVELEYRIKFDEESWRLKSDPLTFNYNDIEPEKFKEITQEYPFVVPDNQDFSEGIKKISEVYL